MGQTKKFLYVEKKTAEKQTKLNAIITKGDKFTWIFC